MAGPVVCVVGAGTAGLEGLLSAREEFGADAELRLIAPDREFRYRPMSPGSLFNPARERGLAIADVVAQSGVTWVADRADAIDEAERNVLTRDSDTVDFDFLLLAVGGRSKRALRQGHVWERGGDPSFLDQILLDIVAGGVRSVAVVVPRGTCWPLPAYELALVLAWNAAGSDARVVLITAEERLLGALGREGNGGGRSGACRCGGGGDHRRRGARGAVARSRAATPASSRRMVPSRRMASSRMSSRT